MIVDSPLLIDLAQGADRIIPQPGDAQVVIPAIISPIIVPASTFNISTLTTEVLSASALLNRLFAKNNQAGADDPLVTLAKGFWTIGYRISTAFDFTQAVGQSQGFFRLSITYQGQVIGLIPIHARSNSVRAEGSFRLLLRTQGILNLSSNITAVGEHADASVALQIEKAY
jgi:hypothetical protein